MPTDLPMSVPKTITDAINSQPATIQIVGASETSTTVRDVPYEEIYRESTGLRETPVERLIRIAASGA